LPPRPAFTQGGVESPAPSQKRDRAATSLRVAPYPESARLEDFCFCTGATDMREHMLLFCLLGLVLTATIMLVAAPGAVTWALAFIE
jgi:hypothetical protein